MAPSSAYRRRRPLGRVVPVLIAAAVLGALQAPAAGADAGDLNGDGRDELVVGVPDEGFRSAPAAGLIHILRGSASGTTTARSRIVTQSSLGGPGEANDRFGSAIAYGDFDGDGRDDVAVGAPTEDFQGVKDVGVVHVLFGSAGRSIVDRNQLVTPFDLVRRPGAGDFFGAALATGRINGDRFDDLVIGIPGRDARSGTRIAAGAIAVVYGSARGLRFSSADVFSQNDLAGEVAEQFDAFGVAVAVGDVDGDGFDDVAVGAPGEGLGAASSAGVANVLYGARNGLRPGRNLLIDLGDAGGSIASGAGFGRSLEMGDYDADGTKDLAIGAPGGADGAGLVAVFAGAAGGLTSTGRLVAGPGEPGSQWGRSLAAGDFDDDGDDDLAVGAPFASAGGAASAGAVTVVAGAPGSGLGSGTTISQAGIAGATSAVGDQFGWAVRSGDFDGNGVDDLVVSARGENLRRADVGVVHVLRGVVGAGLDVVNARTISQAPRAMREQPERGDRFGTGL